MIAMLDAFISSWSLFANSYLSGWLIAIALAQVGCLVVARNQVFLGAAVAQASAGGVALAIWTAAALGISLTGTADGEGGSGVYTLSAIIAAVSASVIGLSRGRLGDSATSWMFLMGGCVPMLLLSHHAHGMEAVNQLFSSSLIGASSFDVWLFACMALAVGAGLAFWRRRVCLVVLDPVFASAVGISVAWWSGGFAVALGVALGSSIASAGTLYAFGCLILPALIARDRCRTLAGMFIAAPVIALASAVLGFIWANAHDLPPGQMAVALMGLTWMAGRLVTWAVAAWVRMKRRFSSVA